MGAFDEYMTIFDNVGMFFCEGCCAVLITELSNGKKGSYFEVVKDVDGLG